MTVLVALRVSMRDRDAVDLFKISLIYLCLQRGKHLSEPGPLEGGLLV
jgi:hypothetical protein